MNGTLPAMARPAAMDAMDCSDTPICTNRSGNAFLNASTRVDSVRSAHSVTTRGSFRAASTNPSPNPLRVGSWLIARRSNSLRTSFAAGFNPVLARGRAISPLAGAALHPVHETHGEGYDDPQHETKRHERA